MNVGHSFRHLFLPHHTNNHRPKVLHVDALFGYVLLLLIFNLALRTLHTALPSVLGYATDIHAQELLAATNNERQKAGLEPLNFNSQLAAAAAAKAQDMFAKGYWAHNSPDGAVPWDFIVSSGYRYTLAGENLAKNFSTSQNVVDAWMASSTHKDNIVKSGYRDVGFAIVNGVLNGEETTLVVQMFGAAQPFAQAAAPTPSTSLEIPAQAASAAAPAAGVVRTVVAGEASQASPLAFASVIRSPMFDIPTVTREVAFVFMGLLAGVIAVDAIVVSRRRIVRLAGHNFGHLLFLGAVVLVSLGMSRGSLI